MTKTGTIFVGKTEKVTTKELPSNHQAEPPSPSQMNNQAQQQTMAVTQLENLALDENPVLMTLSSVFPFEFFPTIITIEKTKVNLKDNLFFGSADIRSILIADIASVESESNLFFATLRILQKMPPGPAIVVSYLKKAEALRARRIIQGLMVTTQNNVDITKVATSELIENVEILGDSKVK